VLTAPVTAPPDRDVLSRIDAYWRAANYLSVGQIYLYDNPLLREPLSTKHIKPRLLGDFGTTPGLNLVYAHLNRVIKARDLSVVYVAGPGHGGPGLVANAYLAGTYSEVYPNVSQDEEGLRRLFTQFPSRAAFPATSRRRRRARSTRAASWATRSRTPTGRHSTTPTCSSPA
jgi:xylulose-5-phosphate/fructose-6-phosphate phosphoketolase